MTDCISYRHPDHGTGDAVMIAEETATCEPRHRKSGPVCQGCMDSVVAGSAADEMQRCPRCYVETYNDGRHVQHRKVSDL